MSCIITYKGKKYSEEQFKEYFNNNKQEFVSSIASNKNVIDSFKRKMEDIDYVFSQSPELASIGTKAQYLQYLSTIFKTSKVKDILYHGTNADLSDGFSKEFSGSGSGSPIMRGDIYTTLQPETTLQYIKGVGTFENKTWTEQHFELKRLINEDNRNKPIDEDIINKIITSGKWKGKTIEQLKQEYNFKGSNLQFVKTIYGIKEGESFNDYKKRKHQEFKNIWHNKKYNKAPYALIVNIKNPLIHKTQDTDYTNFIRQAEKNSNDGLVMYDNNDAFRSDVIVVFNPEQIHILSSKKDIEGFKEFVNNKSSQVENIEVDGVPNINNEEKSLKLALKGLTPEEKISFCNHFGITMTEENGKKC